jgi:hypothetical protein
MKKLILYLSIGIIVILIIVVKPIRTETMMRHIAESQLDDAMFAQFSVNSYERVMNDLSGPMINKKSDYYEYIWYKKITPNDTAKIFIKVYRYPKSWSWRDNFYWTRTTMNYEWLEIKANPK